MLWIGKYAVVSDAFSVCHPGADDGADSLTAMDIAGGMSEPMRIDPDAGAHLGGQSGESRSKREGILK